MKHACCAKIARPALVIVGVIVGAGLAVAGVYVAYVARLWRHAMNA